MNINFSNTNIFQMIYRASGLDLLYFSDEHYKERFFSIVESFSPEKLQEIAQNLHEYYGVSSKDDIFEFENTASHLSIIYSAYSSLESAFFQMKFDEFSNNYLSDDSIKEAFKIFSIDTSADGFYDDFRSEIAGSFYDDAGVCNERLKQYLTQMQDVFAYAPKSTTYAFDIARMLQIATNSFALGYIDYDEFCELYDKYTKSALEIFSSFDEYAASCLLGRAFMFLDDETSFKESVCEHAKTFYILANAPFDVFKASGIWAENLDKQKQNIIKITQNFIDNAEIDELKKSMQELYEFAKDRVSQYGFDMQMLEVCLDEYYQNFHFILKQNALDSLASGYDVYTPLRELGDDDDTFFKRVRNFCDKAKLTLASDEVPLLMLTQLGDYLITNKAIYSFKGVLLIFGKKLVATPWSKVELDAEFEDSLSVVLRYSKNPDLKLDFDTAEYSKEHNLSKSNKDEILYIMDTVKSAFASLKKAYA
ncbi:DUF1266 domain-containing protein [Campylobacter sp. 9BO]|uniref:DUF1266 domain-containing protein n=1 Tax=Campylobacter sp. 9BO TaxID=3424759 RepID=UPI003D34FEBF